MLTIDEAMKIFKVSRPTIYRWVKHYAVKSKSLDGVRYFDIDGLQHAHESRHTK
jgi:DNA-binding transcriptional MerR regulator